MKTKDEFLEEKMRTIAEEITYIKRCVYMIKRIAKYPNPKYVLTYFRRITRIFSYAFAIRVSLINIDTIIAQPYPPSEGLPLVFEQ